jgi:hypothetical protein
LLIVELTESAEQPTAIGRRLERSLAEAWSFRWSFRQALHHTTVPYQLDDSSNLTSWNGTQQHGPDDQGSTSNP